MPELSTADLPTEETATRPSEHGTNCAQSANTAEMTMRWWCPEGCGSLPFLASEIRALGACSLKAREQNMDQTPSQDIKIKMEM